jgi:hypothetical protein
MKIACGNWTGSGIYFFGSGSARLTRNLAVGNSLRERSGSCDQIFRGSGARAAVSLPYPREFGSLPLGRLSRASSFSSAPIACSIVNPEGHS